MIINKYNDIKPKIMILNKNNEIKPKIMTLNKQIMTLKHK